MARTTASTPLEAGPYTKMSSTNNVDRMTKASLVTRSKRSNSELIVDGLALLAHTVVEEWDHNSQQNHRRKMSNALWEVRWLEKYNQLKEFYQKHGRVPVTSFNRADKSLAHWVKTQRRCCKMESRIELLNAVGYVWCPSESSEDRWLKKYNKLKHFY